MRYLILLLLFPAILLAGSQPASVAGTNYTSAYASSVINQTQAYLDTVNQSAYLIFYPDLSKAYSYLGQAREIYQSSPSGAIENAYLARSYATEQYQSISAYRSASLPVVIILALLSLAWLYYVMKPIKKVGQRKINKPKR
ncbi:MAG: hypothetical protein KGH61_04750 [Candidatus Micrarchaeota archaeon]|nr:hypothetical protein [Candidatus Micrarchaeota archaeon]MDE1848226.1 hypothetical protein [Candidatus Micrarchaeota archaeon]MDE1864887.1 hypothetical protein [Candidatus Micrarchaeota archaeon]